MADKLIIYADDAGRWRWRVVAPNGERLASSGESFYSKANALRAARRAFPTLTPQDEDDGA